jgi:UDP-N-acetylglucosamine--N-acetylmuramyl-(pentapeptide) pyrophosphoryl-undecaprenol N-acetylglucosamine transferase
VFGGSQGARIFNETMPKIAGRLLKGVSGLEIVHQTGGQHGVSTKEAYEQAGLIGERRVRVQPYLDEMVREFAQADLILCRSGASTVAELAAGGKPSLLVPFPLAADDHQRKNADVFVAAGAAEMLLEADLNEERLLERLLALLTDRARRQEMIKRVRGLAHPDAVREIGEIVVGLAEGRA